MSDPTTFTAARANGPGEIPQHVLRIVPSVDDCAFGDDRFDHRANAQTVADALSVLPMGTLHELLIIMLERKRQSLTGSHMRGWL